ncbi:hypothetical protein KI387_030935, partial [Taxus chinensis]
MSRKRAAVGGPLFLNDMDAKHSSLMHDYLQLQDEFAGLKNRLQAVKMRKVTLYAEVRFLRRRLKKLRETPSHLKERETNSAIVPCDSLPANSGKSAPEPSSQSRMNNSLGTTDIPVFPDLLRANSSCELVMPKQVNENKGLVSAMKTSA